MAQPPDLPPAVHAALDEGLVALDLPGALAAPLLEYLRLLVHWNRPYNLTAIRDPQAMVVRHLLDSLSLVPYLAKVRTLADLGTGPGLPGIPLALAVPALHVTLVESNGKKARFLREVNRRLALCNVQVAQSRIEAFDARGQFAAITARALDTLAGIVTAGGHLLAPDGRVLAMKGAYPHAEMNALPAGWKVDSAHRLAVPGLDAERHLVVIRRDRTGPGV